MDDIGPDSLRVLLLLATRRDAELTADILRKSGFDASSCDHPAQLAEQLAIGAGAVLLAEESLALGAQPVLQRVVDRQAPWSDLPVLVLTRSGSNSLEAGDAVARLGNVTLLERPLRLAALVSTVRSALRARVRQYQIRTQIQEQERATAALAESARRKDEFLAMLGHELRNPLAPIRNALHLLSAAAPSVGVDEELRGMMRRQVDHMVRLVDDLLEVSRLSRGTIELRRVRLDLGSALRHAIDLSAPQVEAGRHRLEFDPGQESLTIDADPVRIAQVFANLLNNAAKYARPEGDITLAMRREGDEAVVSVRDSGMGIEPEILPHVFEMFMRGPRDEHRVQDGLGIGLTLVRSLVQLHGGSVSAASAGRDRGSEFVVRLPVVAAGAAERSAPGERSAQAEPIPAEGLRVLVVDDNVDAATSMGMVLGLLGVANEVEYSGRGALAAAERFRPDVILLDIGMPEMDGYEVARRLRRDPRNAGTTLVAVTGWSQQQDQRKSQEAGFNHHFSKPADLDALRRLLAELRPRSASARSAPGG